MDAEIEAENEKIEVVDVDLIFREPIEITNFELVNTFWIDPKEETNSTNDQLAPPPETDQESKQLQPLSLKTLSIEDESCSHSEEQLPEEILNESMDDEVFEEDVETVETDLLFRQPENREMELVYTISKGATVNLDELEDEDEDVDVDLWFREPTDTRFELVYTIPLMEDVSVDSFGGILEDVPPPEELDNVVEEAAEFTFKPIENDEEKTETETLTTEVVTVLEKNPEENVGEGSREFIEKVKLTSNDTFDEFDGEEEAFQNAFVKSVETPETPVPEEEPEDPSVSDVLKDAAEKLKIIQDSGNRDTVESEDLVKETVSAPDILGSPEDVPVNSDVASSENVEEMVVDSEEPKEEAPEEVAQNPDPISADANRFDVAPVEENSSAVVPTESESSSDFAQLESVSGEEIPDVYKTLDSLKNEDVFPKEETPATVSEIPTIEVTPEAEEAVVEKVTEVKLEDSGIVETPVIADLSETEIKEAVNGEDVVKTSEEDSLEKNDENLPMIEGAAESELTEAQQSEDVTSEEAMEEVQSSIKLEDSGILKTPVIADLSETEIKEALNGEDVVKTSAEDTLDNQKDDESLLNFGGAGESELPEAQQPEDKEAVEEVESSIKLEDSGIVEAPDIVDLSETEIKDALNAEDVVKTSAEDTLDNQKDDENLSNIEGAAESELPETQKVASEEAMEDLVKASIKLEDSGIIAPMEIPILEKEENTDALNSEDVVTVSDLPENAASEDVHNVNDYGQKNEPIETLTQDELKLEDSGITEIPHDVDVKEVEEEDALNAEGAVIHSDEIQSPDIPENQDLVEEPELKLEDSGVVETPETVDLKEEEIKDALNGEDVAKAPEDIISDEQPEESEKEIHQVVSLEDSGLEFQPTPEVVDLEKEIIEEAMNEPDVIKTSEQTFPVETSEEIQEDNLPRDTNEFETEVKLEDSGITAPTKIIDVEEEVITDALNSEDVVTPEAVEGDTVPKLIFPENFLDEDELPSSVEESVADSEIKEVVSEDVPDKESTPLQETIVEKLVAMVDDALPVDEVASSEENVPESNQDQDQEEALVQETESDKESDAKEESFVEKRAEDEVIESAEQTVEEESMIQKLVSKVESLIPTGAEEGLTEGNPETSDNIQAVTEVASPPETAEEPIEEESMMQKLVSMVENVLPVDAVLPSEDVLNEEHTEKRAEDEVTESPEKTVEEESMIQKLVSKVKSFLPTDETSQTEETPVVIQNEEKPEEAVPLPPETAEETAEGDSMMQKLVSMVENVLPASKVSPEEPIADDSNPPESTKPIAEGESVMEKLVHIVENVVPVDAVTFSEYVERFEKHSEEKESVEDNHGEEEQKDLESIENVLSDKFEEAVEDQAPEIKSSEESKFVERISDAIVPSEDVLDEDQASAEKKDDLQKPVVDSIEEPVESVPPEKEDESKTESESFVDKVVELVEDAFSVEDVIPSEDVLNEEHPGERETAEEEQNEETVLEKLASTVSSAVEGVLPVGLTSSETTNESEESKDDLEAKNRKNSVVAEVIATADIILPVEENDPISFDAEVAENQKEVIEKTMISTADIILPVEESEDKNVLETPFDAEEIVSDSQTAETAVEDIEKIPADEENVLETDNEKSNIVQELVAMAVDILPIDGSVAEDIREAEPEEFSSDPILEGKVPETKEEPEESAPQDSVEREVFRRVKRGGSYSEAVHHDESESIDDVVNIEIPIPVRIVKPQNESVAEEDLQIATVMVEVEQEPLTKTTNLHFTIPRDHEDYGNDYVPFGTEPSKIAFKDDMKEEEEDVVAELNFHPIRQWKDEDVISLQSLKSLVAEVGCTTDVEEASKLPSDESTLKILKVVPSEPSLMELDITNDPSVIHVPIPLMEPATKYLEDMVDWIISDAVREVSEMEVVTESELSEMVPEPLTDLKLPYEDDEKTPEPEQVIEEVPVEVTIPQRPPRAPKTESQKSSDQSKSRVRFGPLNIKLGRSYSEEQQKELVESLERPLMVITSQEPKTSETRLSDDTGLSPLSPNTLAEYEHIPVMDMQSVPHSPQEKEEVEVLKEEPKIFVTETRILGPGKSMEYVGNEEEDGSECLDSIGDLSERTIQRFNTSIDDPSIRRDSFSSISSFGDRQKFRTAIENIRQDLLPFQSSVSQYLDPSINPSQQLLVTNLSMDSPSDLSPNAPPVGFENTAQYLEKMQQQEDRPSAEGSIDSSGFEKVDHEGLEDYGVSDPMQKSVFGSLTADADDVKPGSLDDGFVFIERNEEGAKKKMSSHHDDVIEKNYFGDEAATAKLLESPIAEEARKLVQDAVESASEFSKHAVDDADEIGRELLDNVEHKIEQVKEPVADSLHKAYDGLGDFVHETVPQAVHDFVEDAKKQLPESPVPVKTETPEPLVDIHNSVDQVHDEIDSFLRAGRDPTPPLVEADEDAQEEKPQFGNQTPDEDETTFDRKGPLTIPEEVEKAAAAHHQEDLDDFDPLVTSNTGAAFGDAVGAADALTEEEIFGHQKFETVPRPPTPPKDISDEDVKPSTVNLGPAHHHSHPSSPHHSILKHHGEAWIDFKTIPPCVLDVIYWRDIKKSAIVLSLSLLALFIIAKYPLLTVITYSLLLALGAAAGFRVFKKVEAQIKKTDSENPFSEILSQDLSLPQEKVHAQADVFVEHATCVANTLKKLVFVESPVESIKFGLILWSLTYVASWFSGFTLAILGLVGVFSIPKLYEANQDAIDPHLATISGHLKNVQNVIDEKLPFLRGAPVAAEEKKDQ